GTYQLTAGLPGFQTASNPGLRLAPDSSVRQDIRLQIANMNAMVEVAAFDNRRLPVAAAVGEVLPQGQQGKQNQVRDLPIVGNNVLDLLQVLPGVREEKEIAVKDGLARVDLRGQQGGQQGQLKADFLQKQIAAVTVREYAHTLRPGWSEGSR